MDLNLQDSELLYTFDYGIQIGSLISGLIKQILNLNAEIKF